jgi:hypothetical protein
VVTSNPAPDSRRARREAERQSSREAERPSPPTGGVLELGLVHGRRAAVPRSPRRRFEVALGRSLRSRRAWAGLVVVTLFAVVPAVSMLNQDTVTVAESTSAAAEVAVRPSLIVTPPATTAPATKKAEPKVKVTKKAAPRATATAVKKQTTGSTSRITSTRSGLPWPSGLYMPGSSPANVAAFGAWRGAAADVVVDWPQRQTWDDIVNPTWLYSAWKGTPYTKVFGVPPIPEGGDASIASCAAGSYNDKWRQFGQNIQAAGLADESVIRLGWEFNGDWYKWKADNPSQWAECWRQIVSTVRPEAPKLLFDWNVNRGKGNGVVDAADAYPGNAYVDIIGVDSYDVFPGATTEATWQKQYSGPFGLKHWADFARAHGKKLSVPEWGVYPGTSHAGNNGGDNPFYIAKMRAFFAQQGSRLAYESYFNESAGYYAGSIFGAGQNPIAAAKYRALFAN